MKMGYKKQILLLAFFPFLFVLFGIYMDFIREEYIRIFKESIENVLVLFSLTILSSLIPLYFLKEAVYKTWGKFALVYLPLAILWIATSDPFGGRGYVGILDSREQVTFFVSGLFLVISFIIIITKSLKLRGKD